MRWGYRKQYRDAVKTAKNKKYKEWDSAENRHEDRVTQINRKYGQYGNNFEGKNSKMNRATKKAYNSEINKAWDSYEKSINKATIKYKTAKKQAKADLQANKKEYKNDVKTLKKTLGVGDVNLYNDQGLMIGRVNSTTVAYNELSTRKGKEYADRALEKARNQRYATIAGSTVVLLGASVALQMFADS